MTNDNGTITIIGGTCKTVSVGCRRTWCLSLGSALAPL